MLGQSVMKVIPETQRKQTAEWFEHCRGGETIRNVECTRLDGADHATPVLLTLTLLTDEEGRPDAIAMSARQMPN